MEKREEEEDEKVVEVEREGETLSHSFHTSTEVPTK